MFRLTTDDRRFLEEGILPSAPFGKEPLSIFLKGIINGCCEPIKQI
jgi:hypothetical protein